MEQNVIVLKRNPVNGPSGGSGPIPCPGFMADLCTGAGRVKVALAGIRELPGGE